MAMFCIVCGGDHNPHPADCDAAGMDAQAAKLGSRKWNQITGQVQKMCTNHSAILIRAQVFVDRKYVARADARQREMGLAYVEAERTDLAKEIARFAQEEIERRIRQEQQYPRS